MGYPALIGASAPDGGFTVRYLHWSDHPDRLVPKLRKIWSDTFHTDTTAMVAALLAHDWSSLSPNAGSTVTAPPLTIAGVGEDPRAATAPTRTPGGSPPRDAATWNGCTSSTPTRSP